MSNCKPPVKGVRVLIPVSQIEYVEGMHTLWIHGPEGNTVLRIKLKGIHTIESDVCTNSPFSHGDMLADSDLSICLGKDAKYG